MNFSNFIKKQVRGTDGKSNNYQHTHDRVEFDNETSQLILEEVCLNDYGSCYGRGVGFVCNVPENVEIPDVLLGHGRKWADFENLPVNYGCKKNKNVPRPKHR